MSLPTYEVYVRNRDYQRLDRLDEWRTLTFVQRWNDVGTWTLELDAETVAAGLLPTDGGIIVTRDGSSVFSGRVTERTRTVRTVRYSGVDDNALLAGTLALPDPAGPPYPEFYTDEDVASTVMRNLVFQNVSMEASRVDRRVAALNLQVSDPLLGGTVLVRARFVNLLALLQEIAVAPAAGGLRFWIAQSDADPDEVVFQIAESTDRSSSVVFSRRLGTIRDYADTFTAPEATYIYLAGGDEMDPDRTIVEGGNAAAQLDAGRRIEVFTDARDNDDSTELTQEHGALVAALTSTRKITVDVLESDSFQWGTDWDLGDTVTVLDADGAEYVDVIREVEVNLSPRDGARVTPLVGAVGTSNDDDSVDGRVARHIEAINRRVSHLERHWAIPSAKIASIQNLPDGTITNAMLDEPLQWLPGEIKLTARVSAPTGWLLCNGAAVSRTTYSALYAAIGGTYGNGDGSTTFNLPNLQGRFPMGSTGESGTYPRGSTGGAATIDLSHDHNNATGAPTETELLPVGAQVAGAVAADGHAHTIPADLSATQSVLPPYLALNYIIFAGV